MSARLAGLLIIGWLSLPGSARAERSLSIAFGELDPGTLSVWDAGRMRLRIYLQADSCVRLSSGAKSRARHLSEGSLAVSLAISPKGQATRAQVTSSVPSLRKAAGCLQRVLRKKITFVEADQPYTWKSTLRVGEPEGILVSILRVDSTDLFERPIFESVFTTQIERASCLAGALGVGLSAALNADLTLTPGAPTVAKVTPSTSVPDAVLTCLEPQLAAIVPPRDSVPATVHVFFHLLQAAPDDADSGDIPTLRLETKE